MSAFVDECRREWKRLGVPDATADEMAGDLRADIDEAERDGASAVDLLGTSLHDPRGFAAAWANERGLVPAKRHPIRARWVVVGTLAAVVAICALTATLLTRDRASRVVVVASHHGTAAFVSALAPNRA